MAGYIGKAQSLANLSEADTLDSVTGRGATTTNNLNVGTVTADSLTVDTTTLVVDDTNDRVGVNDSSPEAKLDVYIGTGLTTFGDFSDSLRVQGGNNTGKYVPITFGGYGSYAPASIAYVVTTGTGNTKGDLVFGTRDVTTDTRPTERMRIDSAGRVTMPYQVAFMAGANENNYVNSSPIQFGDTSTSGCFDRGNNFNTSTFRFTAPIDGVYHFDLAVYTRNDRRYARIQKNGSGFQYLYRESASSGDVTLSISINLDLNQNDYIDVAWVAGSNQYYSGPTETWLAGYLIG